jgi:hypothetical protein
MLISSVEEVLRQGLVLLDSVGEENYRSRQDGQHGSPLGAHYRHVLDHFICLLHGVSSGIINYDQRVRDPELENSVEAARLKTSGLIAEFQRLPKETLDRDCQVVYSVGYGDEACAAVCSNFARELAFCVGHAIHHYAILRLLCSSMAVDLPYEFGVAPSTLKHMGTLAAH